MEHRSRRNYLPLFTIILCREWEEFVEDGSTLKEKFFLYWKTKNSFRVSQIESTQWLISRIKNKEPT